MMISYKQRALSWLIDAVISLTPFLMLLPFALILVFSSSANDQLVGRSLLLLGLLPSLFFYSVIGFIQISRGQLTLGQKIMKIKLVKSTGQKTGIINAILYLGSWLGLLLIVIFYNLFPLMLIIYLWPLINKQQRNLFHFISQTKPICLSAADLAVLPTTKGKTRILNKLQQLK